MPTETDRLREIQDHVNAAVEERVTDLLAHLRAVRDVTAQIAAADMEVQRQESQASALEAQLSPGLSRAATLEIMSKVEGLKESAQRTREYRDQLVGSLSTLAQQLKGA